MDKSSPYAAGQANAVVDLNLKRAPSAAGGVYAWASSITTLITTSIRFATPLPSLIFSTRTRSCGPLVISFKSAPPDREKPAYSTTPEKINQISI